MKNRTSIKGFIKRVLSVQVLNEPLRRLLGLKPFSSIIPKKIRRRIPVSGLICVRLPNSRPLYLRSDGKDTVARDLYRRGIDAFENGTLRLFIKLLRYADTVFDIGANTGIYALIAAIDNPYRKVYAFEPVPEICERLRKNVEANKLENLRIEPSAVTNYDGEITLYVPTDLLNMPTTASTLKGFREACEAIPVRAITIDSFVALNNISKVDLMKIDVEATEHRVLEGAKNLLKRDKSIMICEVLEGRTEKSLTRLLDEAGGEYQYFWIARQGLMAKERIEGGDGASGRNYLFIPKSKLQEVVNEIDALIL